MRLFPIVLVSLIAFTLGVVAGSSNTLQGKDAKKQEKKEKAKESLVEKYGDKDSVKVFKEMLFTDNKDLKFDGKKMAEDEAKFLNTNEGGLELYEKIIALHKELKDKPPSSSEAIKTTTLDIIKSRAKVLKALKPILDFRLDPKAPEIGYRLEWSKEKGQWGIKKVKRGDA